MPSHNITNLMNQSLLQFRQSSVSNHLLTDKRLQAMRQGAEVQTPIAVDVTIDGALPMPENEP